MSLSNWNNTSHLAFLTDFSKGLGWKGFLTYDSNDDDLCNVIRGLVWRLVIVGDIQRSVIRQWRVLRQWRVHVVTRTCRLNPACYSLFSEKKNWNLRKFHNVISFWKPNDWIDINYPPALLMTHLTKWIEILWIAHMKPQFHFNLTLKNCKIFDQFMIINHWSVWILVPRI